MSTISEVLLDGEADFDRFHLDRRLYLAILKLGFEKPTLIQAHAIPLALEGKDVLAKAKTGSGKTVSYCVPIIEKALKEKNIGADSRRYIRSVILVPSRELCVQVGKVLEDLTRYCRGDVKVFCATAEIPAKEQKSYLQECPDILVITPARLISHIEANNVPTLNVKLDFLVIDEADLILSFGYMDDVRKITSYLPSNYQSLLMSATLNDDIVSLKKLVLTNPAIVKLEGEATGEKCAGHLQEFFVPCQDGDRYLFFYSLLQNASVITGKVLVFVNDLKSSYRLKLLLEQFSVKSAILNSDMPRNSRVQIIEAFNRRMFDILIATDEGMFSDSTKKRAKPDVHAERTLQVEVDPDVEGFHHDDEEEGEDNDDDEDEGDKKSNQPKSDKKADFGVSRGIDFKEVAVVVNFHCPRSVRDYVHRVGRTARGGANGTAVSFVAPSDDLVFSQIANYHLQRTGEAIMNLESFSARGAENYRYRVNDRLQAITKKSIERARLHEVKMELLYSEKVKAHFEDNPRDLEILQHDRNTQILPTLPHLKNIPDYLITEDDGGQSHGPLVGRKRRRGHSNASKNLGGGKKNDPLRSFSSKKPGAQKPGGVHKKKPSTQKNR